MGRPAVNLLGQRFGLMTIVGRAGSSIDGKAMWLARCDCGREVTRPSARLRRQHTRDLIHCGCHVTAATTQRCAGCGDEKPFADFGPDRRRVPRGLKSRCRKCEARYGRENAAKYAQRARQTQKRWYKKHQDHQRATSRQRSAARYAAKREEILKKQRARAAKDPAHRKAVMAAWNRRHPGRAKLLRDRSNAKDPARVAARAAAWRAANPARLKGYRKKTGARRRAVKAGARVVGSIDFERIKRRDKMRCHICRKKVAPIDLHFDHVIPLAKGGEHSEANLAVSHRRCNQRKQANVLTLF